MAIGKPDPNVTFGSIKTPSGAERNPLVDRLGMQETDIKKIQQGTDTIRWGVSPLFKGAVAGKKRKSSIIGTAKENVFEFPVFVSSTVPLEYATATNTLLEQVYGAYLQMALSIDPVVSYQQIEKKGSQFAKFKTDTTKYLECAELPYQIDTCHAKYTNEDGSVMEFELVSIEDTDAQFINESLDYVPLSEFDHYFMEGGGTPPRPLDDWLNTISRQLASQNVSDRDINRIIRQFSQVYEQTVRDRGRRAADEMMAGRNAGALLLNDTRILDEIEKIIEKKVQDELEHSPNATEEQIRAYRDQQRNGIINSIISNPQAAREALAYFRDKRADERDEEEHAMKKDKAQREANEEARKAQKQAFDIKTPAPEFLDENKIQKMNTMKPLMMKVTMSIMDRNGSVSRPMDYIVGVKTHCRLVDSSILPEVAEYPLKEMNTITRKAKYRAGELKFFKDILFHVKEKKQTAIDSKDPRRKWFRRLYELAHMKGDGTVSRNITGDMSAVHGLIPNATMIISKADVDNIEEKTKIDMLNPTVAKRFCDELFLMSFIVIDTDQESIKILTPDINNDFEVQSLAAVNKQIAQLDTAGATTRDVFKLLR